MGDLDPPDARLPGGRPSGSAFGLLKEQQILDRHDVRQPILMGRLGAGAFRRGWGGFQARARSCLHRPGGRELAHKDERLYVSVRCELLRPHGVVREIDPHCPQPKAVAVMLYIGERAFRRSASPPTCTGAVRYNLVVGIHHRKTSGPRLATACTAPNRRRSCRCARGLDRGPRPTARAAPRRNGPQTPSAGPPPRPPTAASGR